MLTKEQEDILQSASDDEMADATEKMLKETFDKDKYDVEVDNMDNMVVIEIIMKNTDFSSLKQDAIDSIAKEYGLDTKMDELANNIYETWKISGKEKRIILGVTDDHSTVIYSTLGK